MKNIARPCLIVFSRLNEDKEGKENSADVNFFCELNLAQCVAQVYSIKKARDASPVAVAALTCLLFAVFLSRGLFNFASASRAYSPDESDVSPLFGLLTRLLGPTLHIYFCGLTLIFLPFFFFCC
jgi:hypothetical protein